MITAKEAKKWLRTFARHQRQSLSLLERMRFSRSMLKALLKSPAYKKAKVIAVYLGFGSEVSTDGLVKRAWKDRKTVLIPNTSRGLHRPFFQEYKKGDALQKTKFGPMELEQAKMEFPWNKINLVVVPGLAFDGDGHRLGYGGGTYDRILAKTRRAKHIGLFFSYQKIARLPSEKHDFRMDAILTD